MFLEGIDTEGQKHLLRSSVGGNGGSQQRPRHAEKND